MINYQIVPFNVTATRANLDNAYAENIKSLQEKLHRATEKVSAEVIAKESNKEQHVSARQAAFARENSVRHETYGTDTQKVFNKLYEEGYQLCGTPFKIGASGMVSYWIPKELDYKAECQKYEEEFESNHAQLIASFEKHVTQVKDTIQSLVTWYGKESQRVQSKLFFTPEGFK